MTFDIPYWLNKDTRLHQLLVDHDSISVPSDVEIASLLRQAIRESQSHGVGSSVEVPLESPWGAWPDDVVLSSCGISTVRTIDGIHLSVEPWSPAWLACQPNQDPFEKVFQTNADQFPARRRENPMLADPAMASFIKTYRTPGQREAVRAALGQPAGTTLTINLPTGTGKTLAIIGPALSFRGTTIVVVPTTALAIDQEKRLNEDFRRLGKAEERHAYHGGLDESVKERFREQLLEGSKRVVFTSPEALNGSLRYCVMQLAERGLLRALAIDEAHIVEEWGSNFRPDFQMLAGLRRALMAVQRDQKVDQLRTLLLTGTLTESVLKVLHSLFAEDGQHDVVASMATRPEISYWMASVEDDPRERLKRLEETLRYCAKPCIVYVTRRQEDEDEEPVLHVDGLVSYLKSVDFTRIAGVDGGTSNDDKLKLIEGMTGSKGLSPTVDIAVANSAFGLGIDIEGLRTVIHACVPESVERLYQEAGRAGRDGREAVHIWLPTNSDWRLAKRMATTKLPEVLTTRERWNAMFANGETSQGLITIRLATIPSPDVKQGSYNRAWNQRVLTLMSRADMIEIVTGSEWVRRDKSDSGDAEESFETVTVKVLNVTDSAWERLESVRETQHTDDAESLRHLESLSKKTCVNRVFARAFSIEHPPKGVLTQSRIESEYACAGCPECRRTGVMVPKAPIPGYINPCLLLRDPIGSTSATGSQWVLFNLHSSDLEDYCERFLETVISRGICHVVIDRSWKVNDPLGVHDLLFKRQLLSMRPDVFVDEIDSLNGGLLEVLNYEQPLLYLPPVVRDDISEEATFISSFLQTDREFPVPYIVLTTQGVDLNGDLRRGLISTWPHLRLENDDDLEKVGQFR